MSCSIRTWLSSGRGTGWANARAISIETGDGGDPDRTPWNPAQVASLKEQREEEAHQAASKREEEAAKKREAELESLTKKKDAAEKKQFKKGQSDLEKELGF